MAGRSEALTAKLEQQRALFFYIGSIMRSSAASGLGVDLLSSRGSVVAADADD
jgi:hypothetical protein